MDASINNLLYLDAPTGLAGDMLVAALLAAGGEKKTLLQQLSKLPLEDWRLEERTVLTHGVQGTKVNFITEESHVHRGLSDIFLLLDQAALPKSADQLARTAFRYLAEAEGKVHGCPAEEIHFHEVGALDSILDICAVATLLDQLQIHEVYCSPLPWSSGSVRCAHGIMPAPAPATVELLRGFHCIGTEFTGELITPTGAALLKAMKARQEPLPACRILAAGSGAGSRELPVPNLLRAVIGAKDDPQYQAVGLITANVDDCSGEALAALTEAVLARGALDICHLPITMKKGRPAWQIQIMTKPGEEEDFARLLMEHSSAIGCRIRRERRIAQPRRSFTVETPFGRVDIKESGNTLAPENDSVSLAAARSGVSWKEVYQAALAAGKNKGGNQ